MFCPPTTTCAINHEGVDFFEKPSVFERLEDREFRTLAVDLDEHPHPPLDGVLDLRPEFLRCVSNPNALKFAGPRSPDRYPDCRGRIALHLDVFVAISETQLKRVDFSSELSITHKVPLRPFEWDGEGLVCEDCFDLRILGEDQ